MRGRKVSLIVQPGGRHATKHTHDGIGFEQHAPKRGAALRRILPRSRLLKTATIGSRAACAKLPTIDSNEIPRNVLEKLGEPTAFSRRKSELIASAVTPYLALLAPLNVRWCHACLVAGLARVREPYHTPSSCESGPLHAA